VSERLAALFPFAIAVVLPPAGLLLGAVEWQKDREQGIRLIVVAVLAAVVWTLLFVA
jgi:hypothetical protein